MTLSFYACNWATQHGMMKNAHLSLLAINSGCSGFGFDPRDFAVELDSFFVLSFVLANLLAGKCSLAIRGRGARASLSNPRTQTYPAKHFFIHLFRQVMLFAYLLFYSAMAWLPPIRVEWFMVIYFLSFSNK